MDDNRNDDIICLNGQQNVKLLLQFLFCISKAFRLSSYIITLELSLEVLHIIMFFIYHKQKT